MVQPKNQVFIHLKTVINDTGELEENEVKAAGSFYQRNNLDVLTYKEELEKAGEVNTLITIQPERVTIKRTGAVSMHQQFQKEKLTENVYQHPHGNIHMETFTNGILYRAPGEKQPGLLQLEYTMKLNGQNERRHTLELLFTEEDSQ